jgi:serine/threonine protein kinase
MCSTTVTCTAEQMERPQPNHFGLAHVTCFACANCWQVCRALAALEACSPPLLHRDVKPSNVFMDGSGTARLGDFGLARPMPTSRATLTGETGTYLYMSPEMVR